MTKEAIEFYKQSKVPPSNEINLVYLPTTPGKPEKKFRLGNMTGQFFEAFGIKRKKKKETPSQAASREQRRGRIFDGAQLGSMTQVDNDLKKDKE